jgi:oligogalacturonide lyase
MKHMANERIQHIDAGTGVEVLQLTSFPITHWLMGPTPDSVSPDSSTLLLQANSTTQRNSKRDLWRVDSDGDNLEMLVEGVFGGIITTDGKWAVTSRDGAFIRVPLGGSGDAVSNGGNVEEIGHVEGLETIHVSARTPDGAFAFAQGKREDDTLDIVGVDLQTGRTWKICRVGYVMPVQVGGANHDRLVASCSPISESGDELRPWGRWSFDFEGGSWSEIPFDRSTNHYCVRGGTDEVVTTVPHPGNALDVASPGDAAARVLSEGPTYWHVTCDATGEWAVADTNWPDTGLQLVHLPSGRFRTLCQTGASGGHAQWTHAHPSLAPEADWVLFTSDRTGVQQVYRAEIPASMKAELAAG